MFGDPFQAICCGTKQQYLVNQQALRHNVLRNVVRMSDFWSLTSINFTSIEFWGLLYLCLWSSPGLSVMCEAPQWITYQSYWSWYSEVDRVCVGALNYLAALVQYMYAAFPLHQRGLSVDSSFIYFFYIIIDRWTHEITACSAYMAHAVSEKWIYAIFSSRCFSLSLRGTPVSKLSVICNCLKCSLSFSKFFSPLRCLLCLQINICASLPLNQTLRWSKGLCALAFILLFYHRPSSRPIKLTITHTQAAGIEIISNLVAEPKMWKSVFLCWHDDVLLTAAVTKVCLQMWRFRK